MTFEQLLLETSFVTTTTRVRKGCCSKLNRGLCKIRKVLAQHLSILCHAEGLHLASNFLNHQTTFTTKKSNLTEVSNILFIIFIKSSTYSRTMGKNIMRNAPIVRYAPLALMLLADLASGRLTGRNLDEGSILNSTSWKWKCAITAPNVNHNVTSCESPCEVNAIETNGQYPSCIYSKNTDTCTQIYNPMSLRQLMGQNYNEIDMFCVKSGTGKFDLTGFDVVNEEIINQKNEEVNEDTCKEECKNSSCQGVRFVRATGMCVMYTPITASETRSSSPVETDDKPSSSPSIRTIQITDPPTTDHSTSWPPCPRKKNNNNCPFEKDMKISFRGKENFENSKSAPRSAGPKTFVTTFDDDGSYIQIKYRFGDDTAEYIRKRGEDKCCSYIKSKVAKACRRSLEKIELTHR